MRSAHNVQSASWSELYELLDSNVSEVLFSQRPRPQGLRPPSVPDPTGKTGCLVPDDGGSISVNFPQELAGYAHISRYGTHGRAQTTLRDSSFVDSLPRPKK